MLVSLRFREVMLVLKVDFGYYLRCVYVFLVFLWGRNLCHVVLIDEVIALSTITDKEFLCCLQTLCPRLASNK